jgi:phosphoglucomutase
VLDDIYRDYGYYKEKLINIKSPGIDGIKNIARFMENLRHEKLKKIGNEKVLRIEDYLTHQAENSDGSKEVINLPSSDVLKYIISDGWIVFRPSGTEPKIKVYLSLHGENEQDIKATLDTMEVSVKQLLKDKGLINE